jgi:hypothetical protein
MAPLMSNTTQQRQPRSGDVNTSASLPQYHRPTDKEYPTPIRKRSGPGESGDVGHYVGYSPEHEQPLPYVEYSISASIFSWTGGCYIDTLIYSRASLSTFVFLISRFNAFALLIHCLKIL